MSSLQEKILRQLSDKAIRNYTLRFPQNIQFISEIDLHELIPQNGLVHFLCGGGECQSMSLAGQHQGIDDKRLLHFLDMICILDYVQKQQCTQPLYLFENTYPGKPGQYPRIDDAAKVVE